MLIPYDLLLYVVFLGLWLGHPDGFGAAGGANPRDALGLAAAGALQAGAAAWAVSWAFRRRLRRAGSVPATAAHRLKAALHTSARLLILAFSALGLCLSGLPAALAPDGGWTALLWGVIPYLAAYAAVWAMLQPAFARLDEAAGQRPARGGRLGLVARQAQYGLCFLLLWAPLAASGEWLGGAGLGGLVLPAGAALIWASPALLAWLWRCRPLAPGPALEAVERAQRRAGYRFARVLEWPLDGKRGINAASMGFAPPFCWLLVSRGLADRLDPAQMEAVASHEIGHARLRHQLAFAAMGMAALAVLFHLLDGLPVEGFVARALLALLALAAMIRLGLGGAMRLFERQADLYAAQLAGDPEPLAQALERIGEAAGASRNAPSWHHYGIAQRVAFVRQASREPALAARHHRQADRLRLGAFTLGAFLAGAAALSAWLEAGAAHGNSGAAALREMEDPRGRARPPGEAELARHRRLMAALLPEG